MKRWENKIKFLILVIEVMWIILLVFGCIAIKDTICSRAATPFIDGRTGQWVFEWVYLDDTQEDAVNILEAPPIDELSSVLDEVDVLGNKMEYLGEFKITYYCPCSKCNGYWGAIDGYGHPLKWGTVAVDPSVIPMHTKLIIDGYDAIFEALDTGSGVGGNHIDMFVPVSHSEALAMPQGQKLKVWRYYG